MRAFSYLIAALLLGGTASAQQSAPMPQLKVPTTFNPVGSSLTALLNDHWVIVSGGIGMLGPTFVLRDSEGYKYIICGINTGQGMGGDGKGPKSECWVLN